MYRQTYMDTTSRSLLKMESASLQWDPLPVLLANVQVETLCGNPNVIPLNSS